MGDGDPKDASGDEEQLLARFFALTPDLCCVGSPDGRFLRLSASWFQTLGWSEAEMIGRPHTDFMHPDDVEPTRARLASGKLETPFENRYRCKDGSYRWLQWVSRPAGDLLIAVARDVTATRENEQHYRALFDESAMPKLVFDVSTFEILAANTAATRLYGRSRAELLAMKVTELRPEEEVDDFLTEVRTCADATRRGIVARHMTKEGKIIDVEVSSHPITFLGRRARSALVMDVTARRQLESQLLHVQKMEAIGTLAGGVAHDFNNMLSVIVANASMVLAQLPADSPVRQDVLDMLEVTRRGAALTQQLLAFSRRQSLQPRRIVLENVVRNVEKMLRRLIGEDIEVELDLCTTPRFVLADPSQLEQVLLNLCVNARDAMPGGGVLTISTTPIALGEREAHAFGGLVPGEYVALDVTDTGTGIPPQILPKIFEPFFTTKEHGKGTGLGLSTAFGIVKQSGGAITAESTDTGARFRVMLPTYDTLSRHPSEPGPASARGGSETILLVEDESLVRASLGRVLRDKGYTVIEAGDGPAAVAMCGAAARVDLLLTDVVMPGEDGIAVARRVREHFPDARVLYMSGYTDHAALRAALVDQTRELLRKPITPRDLARRVRLVLDS